MPIQQFRLYDILVDIVPGIIFIFMADALLQTDLLKILNIDGFGASGAVILVTLGYILGRLVHFCSSICSDIIMKHLFTPRAFPQENTFIQDLFWVLKLVFPVEDKEEVIKWALDYYPPEPDWFPQVRFPDYNQNIINSLSDDLENKYDFNMLGNLDDFIPFAESKLYSGDHLYHRYNILTTFFRNMSFLMWLFVVVISVQALFWLLPVNHLQVLSPWMNSTYVNSIPLVSLILSCIFSIQLQKFSTQRNRHLIIDLYQVVRDETD